MWNSPDVELCGYTIPHPSETKMNIRIQTWGKLRQDPSMAHRNAGVTGLLTQSTEDTGTTAYDALRKGLEDLMDACDIVTQKFGEARDEFEMAGQ